MCLDLTSAVMRPFKSLSRHECVYWTSSTLWTLDLDQPVQWWSACITLGSGLTVRADHIPTCALKTRSRKRPRLIPACKTVLQQILGVVEDWEEPSIDLPPVVQLYSSVYQHRRIILINKPECLWSVTERHIYDLRTNKLHTGQVTVLPGRHQNTHTQCN